jgi:hypothetical protein
LGWGVFWRRADGVVMWICFYVYPLPQLLGGG